MIENTSLSVTLFYKFNLIQTQVCGIYVIQTQVGCIDVIQTQVCGIYVI